MRITSLAALDADAQRDAFNRVYEGYLVPTRVTTEQLALHLDHRDVARTQSPVWLDDTGAVLALAALAIRDDRGWVAGFGVAPPARGQGIGGRLLAAVLATVTGLGLRQVELTVLTGNDVAIRLYERAGFVTRRPVRIFGRDPAAGPLPVGPDAVHELALDAALTHAAMVRGHAPVWQREAASLRRRPVLTALTAGPPDAPRAVAIVSADEDDPLLLDLAGDPVAAQSLLAALVERFPTAALRLGNEPADSPLCAVLEACGWRELIRQYEMVRAIEPSPAG